jgi:spore germination cell wall hydrolase CwlJ-like protein
MNLFIQLFLMALTVVMEAGGESRRGKLGVAWVLHTRQKLYKRSLSDTAFAKYQFSAWLTGSATLMNVDQITDATFFECLMLCIAAVFEFDLDPTFGATHYLAKGSLSSLPSWYDESKVTTVIGAHTFLKL